MNYNLYRRNMLTTLVVVSIAVTCLISLTVLLHSKKQLELAKAHLESENKRLNEMVTTLQRENEAKVEQAALRADNEYYSPDGDNTENETVNQLTSQQPISALPAEEFAPNSQLTAKKTLVSQSIQEIDNLVGLTLEEQDKLTKHLMTALSSAEKNPEQTVDAFREILGDDRLAQLTQLKTDAANQAVERRVDERVLILSHKLNLSEEKQALVRDIYLRSENSRREMIKQYFQPDNPMWFIEAVEVADATIQMQLNEALRPILNDEEYNGYLEEIASTPPKSPFGF